MPDPDKFVYIEVKRSAKRLSRDKLISLIRQSMSSASQKEYESEYVHAFELPQEVLKGDPNLPWNLTPPRENLIKKALYSTANSVPLSQVCVSAQGVTPGGGCLDIYLVNGDVAKDLEARCLRPAVEADDIKTWIVNKTSKWLIYPYDDDGEPLNFGKLDLNLAEEKARSEIDRLIVTGAIKYPKCAKFLVSFFSKLSQRMFEKKTLSEYGKNWFEYHRPREAKLLCKIPKIVTRRMTREVEFSLDTYGVLPTDGCIAVVPRSNSKMIENLKFLGLNEGEATKIACYYLLSILNSSFVKFLLKSTADFWQGNYYQVREEFLDTIPVRLPNRTNFKQIDEIVKLAKTVTSGNDSNIDEVEKRLYELYGLGSSRKEIERFLASRK